MSGQDWNDVIREMQEAEKAIIQFTVHAAKMNWLYYQELRARGFNDAQAIELVKATGIGLQRGGCGGD